MAKSKLAFDSAHADNYKHDFCEKWRILTSSGASSVWDLLIATIDLTNVYHDLCDVPIQLLWNR